MEKSIIPKLAFAILKESEQLYKIKGCFESDILESLYSNFHDTFLEASELLEKYKVHQYSTPDKLRTMYKVATYNELHTVFENINYCTCDGFTKHVLDLKDRLTCKHVLAVSIARSTGKIVEEIINPATYEEVLNTQLEFFDD
ncbi:zinc finger SWIM domain-containing protein 7-like [Sitophilus oryzae]|uniref:Zinc finger SWIM domain-containing protein 7-like n=1 Tax=Sitophilus oryzae TaxID=7048 RepID=A0A6J2YP98_SITOR|nr:zinc finger SWIM domain-containing protein 7-like [Sitophilus oryzae]